MNRIDVIGTNGNDGEHYGIHVKRIGGHDLQLPAKAKAGDAGFDLRAVGHGVLLPGEAALFWTGFAWAIPDGVVGMVCPRSGLALNYGITVLNAPGIVDSGYRGEVGVILINHGRDVFHVQRGDRIAQMVMSSLWAVSPYDQCCEVAHLADTERGAGGFGHTGTE